MLALATTAKLSNSSPAEVIGIDDPEIAFAFDRECAEVLNETEVEKQREILEMAVTGQIIRPPKRTNASPVDEITSANFRDQGF